MASEVRALIPPDASNLIKFKLLRDYLYRPSLLPLSGRQPFVYNLEDDRNPRSKLLSVYLSTHKGNCVSMPLLFVILGQKLGIPVTLTTAPGHLYVKFRGDNGQWYGVETTSGGGWAEDDWQQKQFPTLTPQAIANAIYMQPLKSRRCTSDLRPPSGLVQEHGGTDHKPGLANANALTPDHGLRRLTRKLLSSARHRHCAARGRRHGESEHRHDAAPYRSRLHPGERPHRANGPTADLRDNEHVKESSTWASARGPLQQFPRHQELPPPQATAGMNPPSRD